MKPRDYQGFELGPIRPPSEAHSLLLRVTRNCPWNRCTFCGLYKGEKFSIRPVEHVIKDIDAVQHNVEAIQNFFRQPSEPDVQEFIAQQQQKTKSDRLAFHAALNWIHSGMTSRGLTTTYQTNTQDPTV